MKWKQLMHIWEVNWHLHENAINGFTNVSKEEVSSRIDKILHCCKKINTERLHSWINNIHMYCQWKILDLICKQKMLKTWFCLVSIGYPTSILHSWGWGLLRICGSNKTLKIKKKSSCNTFIKHKKVEKPYSPQNVTIEGHKA